MARLPLTYGWMPLPSFLVGSCSGTVLIARFPLEYGWIAVAVALSWGLLGNRVDLSLAIGVRLDTVPVALCGSLFWDGVDGYAFP